MGIPTTHAAVIQLPPSKSLAARAMILGAEVGDAVCGCDDLRVLSRALARNRGIVDVEQSGTALRFLTARYAATPGADVLLTGSRRLRERPVAPLVESLRSLGADISYSGCESHAPLTIRGRRLPGGTVRVDARQSSQYVSALMLAAPLMQSPLCIEYVSAGSEPYIDMTVRICRRFGLEVTQRPGLIEVSGMSVTPENYAVEPDWSAAAFFYELTAASGIPLLLQGLIPPGDSLQGDSAAATLFRHLGVITEPASDGLLIYREDCAAKTFQADLSPTPDMAPALAVASALCGVSFRLTGLGTLALKESDRLESITEGLRALGFGATHTDSEILWHGATLPTPPDIIVNSAADHRIAMAFGIAAALRPGISVDCPGCAAKSFPGFAEMLRRAIGKTHTL